MVRFPEKNLPCGLKIRCALRRLSVKIISAETYPRKVASGEMNRPSSVVLTVHSSGVVPR